MQKIILVGYMAVGKTTIAHLLAEKTSIKFVDLDKLIENKEGVSVPEIFLQHGEIYFRKLEHELFKESVASQEKLIISTGGGTPCYANNHLLLQGEGIASIYLKASIGVLLERLQSGKDQRPLVSATSDEALEEFVAKHLFERSYFYTKASHTVNVDNKTPEAITEEIIALLH